MADKLWTARFAGICAVNGLLFASLYMQLSVIPFKMTERYMSMSQVGLFFLVLVLGIFIVGPFHAWLVDACKRQRVCIFAIGTMLASMAGYAWIDCPVEFWLLTLLQGATLGIASMATITLAIDITNSVLRSAGNVSFSWITFLCIIMGLALGPAICNIYGENVLVTSSIVTGLAGVVLLLGIYVPFRAPIVVSLCSIDRFWLLRASLPAFNMVLVTFVLGLLIPSVYAAGGIDIWRGGKIPFFAVVGVGYLFSLFLVRLLLLKEKSYRLAVVGFVLEILALFLLRFEMPTVIAAILLGAGVGMLIPKSMILFVKLSHHCQRGTANTTHLLSAEVGIALGCTVSCLIVPNISLILTIGCTVALVAFLFFLFVTYPYYLRKKVR